MELGEIQGEDEDNLDGLEHFMDYVNMALEEDGVRNTFTRATLSLASVLTETLLLQLMSDLEDLEIEFHEDDDDNDDFDDDDLDGEDFDDDDEFE